MAARCYADCGRPERGSRYPWIAAPPVRALRTDGADGAFRELSSVLTDLVQRHAVSGHEWSVRRAVLASLPVWAQERAVVDDIGNIILEAGPPGPATVFIAHMDEVGYQIGGIAPDGTMTLRPQGGVVASAWEGQTALVHFDPPGAPSTISGLGSAIDPRWKTQSLGATAPPPLRGVFRIRTAAQRKNPGPMQAWFGLDAKGLAERGVVVGMQVTSHKEGLRLGRTRYTARSLDDRAGTVALLRAIQTIPFTRWASSLCSNVRHDGRRPGGLLWFDRRGCRCRRLLVDRGRAFPAGRTRQGIRVGRHPWSRTGTAGVISRCGRSSSESRSMAPPADHRGARR